LIFADLWRCLLRGHNRPLVVFLALIHVPLHKAFFRFDGRRVPTFCSPSQNSVSPPALSASSAFSAPLEEGQFWQLLICGSLFPLRLRAVGCVTGPPCWVTVGGFQFRSLTDRLFHEEDFPRPALHSSRTYVLPLLCLKFVGGRFFFCEVPIEKVSFFCASSTQRQIAPFRFLFL